MLPRHANVLLGELENVANVGRAVLNRNLLIHWYDQQRLTVSIWCDIQEKWQEVLDNNTLPNKDVPLFVGEGDGTVTLIYGEGLATDSTWFKDISTLAKGNSLAFVYKGKGK